MSSHMAPADEKNANASTGSELGTLDSLDMTPDQERAMKHKVDIAIIPYFLSSLSTQYVNIGQARLANLEKDLHLKGNQYDIALTVFFVSYVFFEVPSNLAIRWLKPHRWICFIMVSWSIAMILMGVVNNFGGLVATRFILGLAESGVFPGITLLLTTWYNRNEQNFVISLFYAGATLAGAFGGILAFGIRHMDGVGGKGGWAWIFILEGLLTFLCAIPAWWLIPDFPEDHRVLKGIDRERWLHRLTRNQGVTSAPLPFSWRQVWRAFGDWRTYVYALGFIGIAEPVYSLSLFMPTIIKELGYTNANANLLSVPPYVFGFITTILVAIASDRLVQRGIFIIGGMLAVIVGYTILIANVSTGVKYFALFLCVGGVSPCVATSTTLIGNNYGPVYTRAAAMGFFFSVGNCAGIISSNVYPNSTAPRFIRGHSIAIAFSFMTIICISILMASNWRENVRRDKVYGAVAPDGSDAHPRKVLTPEQKATWGLEGLSELEIIELGDRHPGFRYIL
ncbi:hypothetical protein BS47DRAFT_1345338 [Hydnum rufescens UP504]|uniref:Major facilitator superfamily (MFS) profile domain-containing protein n=1 Tax=Hydnum rufescens UP504 TaxID=1448309 RepID=A0A9P6AV81_9AGAM|nr:hypothetical protein BS47DRAFT_1345338 [Hydnum rufescens UP504]